jgi:hypothetical protein
VSPVVLGNTDKAYILFCNEKRYVNAEIQYPSKLSTHPSFLHELKGKYACCVGIFIK